MAPPCPHFEAVEGKTLRQLFSKVAAVRSQDRELFEFTHRPIEVHQQPQGTDTQERIVPEERVYEEFSLDRTQNFTVVIEGEVGTGKSELCAYLAHRLADDGRPILHVDKNDDLMSLLSESLPEFYRREFGEELPDASKFKQLRDDLRADDESVAAFASSAATLNLRKRGFEVKTSDRGDRIQDFIRDKLSLLVEKGEFAREIKFISEQAYKQNDFLQIFEGDLSVTEAVKEFNREIWRSIRDHYETASLDDVLERIGTKFTDTRPVVIFEDFGITAMEGERLRDYMELDTSSGWDFVVAGTRDSTQVLHTQTAEDRFEFYRTNRRDSNSVLFLDEGSAVDFIRPYLGYFKSIDGSVSYDRGGEGLDITLEPAAPGSLCAQCGFCDESFRDLYPFNEPFLRRIYAGLSESEQSPREYVMAVFDVLRDFYEGLVEAPSSADRLDSIRNPVAPATRVYEDAEPLAKLARWYGRRDGDDAVSVPSQFVTAFGFDSVVDRLEYVQVRDRSVLVPTGDVSGDTTSSPETEPDTATTSPPTPRSKAERLVAELTPNVQPWQNNPQDFPDISRYMRVGLGAVVETLTDDYRLYDGMDLRYNLSSQKKPFVFTGDTRAPDDDQIAIDEHEFRLSGLQKLLKYGIHLEEETRTSQEPPLEELGTQLTGYARLWRRKVRTKEIEGDGLLFKTSGFTPDKLALAAYAHVFLFDSPTTEFSARALNQRFIDGGPYGIDGRAQSRLQTILSADQYENLTRFMEYAECYEQLIEGFYGISSKQLDVARIRDDIEDSPPYRVLDGLGRTNIKNVSARVRFDTSNKLRGMADTAYDLKRIVEALDADGYDGDTVQTFTTELDSLSLEQISELTNTLKSYDGVDPEMLESLSKFTQLPQSAVDDAAAAARLAERLPGDTMDRRIQSILISHHLAGSDVYERYNAITLVGGGSTGPFAERFKSVSEYYVE
jgi:hypothetical protein